MTTFWSLYITVLTIGFLIAMTLLIFVTRKGEPKGQVDQTLGHSFDGIQEYDNPLPKWWFLLFVGTIIFAFAYLILYPGYGNFKGLLPGYQEVTEGQPFSNGETGWTGVHQWEKEMARADAKYGPIFATYAAMPIEEVAKDERAMRMGERMFATYCSICHGSDAKGFLGFPNLTDTSWRWGGDPETIETTILHGRQAVMAPWGEVLQEDGVRNVVGYVRTTFSQLPIPSGVNIDMNAGKQIYDTVCVACHMPDGNGNTLLGSGNLTQPDAFIYGTSFNQMQETVRNGRQGQMPAQEPYLGKEKVHILAAYVYSLSRNK